MLLTCGIIIHLSIFCFLNTYSTKLGTHGTSVLWRLYPLDVSVFFMAQVYATLSKLSSKRIVTSKVANVAPFTGSDLNIVGTNPLTNAPHPRVA